MDSNPQQHHHQMSSGLMRYRSAPSSYFTDIMDREFCKQFLNRPSSPETERIFARFMKSDGEDDNNTATQHVTPQSNQQTQFDESGAFQQQQQQQQQQQSNINTYSSVSQTQGLYQTLPKPPLPNQNIGSAKNVTASMGMNQFPQSKTGGVGNSTLIRHSSSPAGLFAGLDLDTGYAAMRGMGNYEASINRSNEDASFSSTSRLKNFSPSGLMSPIEDKSLIVNNFESEAFVENRGGNFATGFSPSPWDDSVVMSGNITGLKRLRDDNDNDNDNEKAFSGLNPSEIQNLETKGTRPPTLLSHHLSLPKSAAEMAAIDKILSSHDSFKIRAKRGFATHPRSIAERVRRTKISERMRKLQELVPNMEKQTNTSDMLDFAVEYIKDLQHQLQTLSDKRTKCNCPMKQPQQE